MSCEHAPSTRASTADTTPHSRTRHSSAQHPAFSPQHSAFRIPPERRAPAAPPMSSSPGQPHPRRPPSLSHADPPDASSPAGSPAAARAATFAPVGPGPPRQHSLPLPRLKKPLGRLTLHPFPPASAPSSAHVPHYDLAEPPGLKHASAPPGHHHHHQHSPAAPDAHPQPHSPLSNPLTSELKAQQRWQALKKRLGARKSRHPEARIRHGPDLAQELASGVLPVLLLKMGLERDESGDKRVPVLLNHLHVKVTDSLEAGAHAGHAIFRIELSYGEGLSRWVVYREMRDFVNLHTHYRAAALRGRLGIAKSERLTAGSMGLGTQEQPVPPLPKLKHTLFWGRDSAQRHKAIHGVRLQLEQWLTTVCRLAALRPDANRLCKFLEISALALALAGRPGVQGKQGYLAVHSNISRKGSHPPTALRFLASSNHPWCMVRESYLLLAEQLGGLTVADVFLFDTDFRITRPRRIYRHPLPRPPRGGGDGDGDDEGEEEGRNEEGVEEEEEEEEEEERGGEEEEEEEEVPLYHGPAGNAPPSAAPPSAAPTSGTGGARQTDDVAFIKSAQINDMQEGREIDEQHAHGVSAHTFYLTNSHQKLKLIAHNERQMNQFIASLQDVTRRNSYAGPNRFDSFAPIRLRVNATPLIDGRDYYWAVSKALARAKDRIMIHDWWLSPELYLRRPGRPGFRLDTILRKKAEEGVKVFVILYNEVSNNVTPTDSNYSKQRLISLHRNIMVQRSPSHFSTGTFYWAHHEKLCVVDETIAFVGGLDLCFGRWDTPAHVLTDDVGMDADQSGVRHEMDDPRFLGPVRDTPEGTIEAHVWPGQDYANERVKEWSVLNRPEEDLFPRDKFPRMPWHDVGFQVVGQPARDLARHFIQRWNYLLRIKNHTRQMPFLLPPADFSPREIKRFNLEGTCEAQICRSGGPWSLGTPNRVEHSIQNAYLKAIENSEHFVYIENQFFITSTLVETTKIENHIGDALVDRILRAHRDDVPWRAIIVMPLVPGFPLPIDHPDASSVRLIVEAQYRTICRGKHSIFGRLQAHGIDPEEYISFYGLRSWARLRDGTMTTEQVYIHGKLCIVDDRVVICGSANINERSQRGDRDSELAIVLRDTHLIPGRMAGEPFEVGKMPHELRVRLMQEHLGIDVDALQMTAAGRAGTPQTFTSHTTVGDPYGGHHGHSPDNNPLSSPPKASGGGELSKDQDTNSPATPAQKEDEPAETHHAPFSGSTQAANLNTQSTLPSVTARRRKMGTQGRFALPSEPVPLKPDDLEDPISEACYYDRWIAIAERNTLLYRRALRVVPDDTVKTWSEYKWFVAYGEKLAKAQQELFGSRASVGTPTPDKDSAGNPSRNEVPPHPSLKNPEDGPAAPSEPGHATTIKIATATDSNTSSPTPGLHAPPPKRPTPVEEAVPRPPTNGSNNAPGWTPGAGAGAKGFSTGTDFSPEDLTAIERLLASTQGHLVQLPLRWLEQESFSSQLTWQSDLLMPLQIFF